MSSHRPLSLPLTLVLAAAMSLGAANTAEAQFGSIKDRIKQKVADKAVQKAGEKIDEDVDGKPQEA